MHIPLNGTPERLQDDLTIQKPYTNTSRFGWFAVIGCPDIGSLLYTTSLIWDIQLQGQLLQLQLDERKNLHCHKFT